VRRRREAIVIGVNKEVIMPQVEITVKVNGSLVSQHEEVVDGTLEQLEEKIDAMSRKLAAAALQGAVNSVAAPRPLFRRKAGSCGTKDTRAER